MKTILKTGLKLAVAVGLFFSGQTDAEIKSGYNEIYRYYEPAITSYTRTRVLNLEDSKDIVQDTFVRVWENRKNFRHAHKKGEALVNYCQRWIFAIARNVRREHFRKRKSRRECGIEPLLSEIVNPMDQYLHSVYTMEEVLKVLGMMPNNQSSLLIHVDGRDGAGPDSRGGDRTRNMYHKRMSRARSKFAEIWQKRNVA